MFQLNMIRGALQSELDSFFSIINNDAEGLSSEVTKSAYCQARMKFSSSAFIEINQMICEQFYQQETIKKWHGHRLLAVDGSVIQLPLHKTTQLDFDKSAPHANHLVARISELYDPLNKLSIDMQITHYSVGERAIAHRHLARAEVDDLILYDRGYPAVWLMKAHLEKGVDFCMRVPDSHVIEARKLVASEERDIVVTIPLSWHTKKTCRAYGVSDEPITVRLVKVDIPDSEEVEVLITSLLDQETYPYEDFAPLYHQRWFSEENYKSLKSKLEIENVSGYSKNTIEQEIQAKTVTRNLAAIISASAQEQINERSAKRKLKRSYQVNFANGLRNLKDNIVRLLLSATPEILIKRLITSFARKPEAVRNGRKFNRDMKKRTSRFTMQYKHC